MDGIIRQGDVWIIPLSHQDRVANTRVFLDKNVFPAFHNPEKKKGDLILAAGEVTGHHHRIARKRGLTLFRPKHNNGTTILHVPKSGATVTHEEHAALDIPAGDYKVVIAREYVPQAAPRWVYD